MSTGAASAACRPTIRRTEGYLRIIERFHRRGRLLDVGCAYGHFLENARRFGWRVEGVVTHFAHQHRRTNLQRARYGVAYDGEGWKIASMDLLEHRRADDGQDFVTLLGGDAEEGF